jgi:hypothetical protein
MFCVDHLGVGGVVCNQRNEDNAAVGRNVRACTLVTGHKLTLQIDTNSHQLTSQTNITNWHHAAAPAERRLAVCARVRIRWFSSRVFSQPAALRATIGP